MLRLKEFYSVFVVKLKYLKAHSCLGRESKYVANISFQENYILNIWISFTVMISNRYFIFHQIASSSFIVEHCYNVCSIKVYIMIPIVCVNLSAKTMFDHCQNQCKTQSINFDYLETHKYCCYGKQKEIQFRFISWHGIFSRLFLKFWYGFYSYHCQCVGGIQMSGRKNCWWH